MNSDLLYPSTLPSLADRLYSPKTSSQKETSGPLEETIHSFHVNHHERLQNYLRAATHRKIPEAGLYVLQETRQKGLPPNGFHPHLQSFPHSTENTGGYFIRWNGKGIVLNPGPYFLDYFHKEGLHVKDIDFVIVTRANPDAYADIKDIHTINVQLNKIGSELQIIHYYLIQSAYEILSPVLKPHFKQERHTIHPLEFFIDSPEIEKIDIDQGIILNYFSNEKYHQELASNAHAITKPSSLGIRLDFLQENKVHTRMGYISGTAWTPFLAHDLGNCDLLIAGFGNTTADDYEKVRYNEDSLGYYGCFTLLEELKPKLMIYTEFDGRDGDIRLDIIKRMRQEYSIVYPDFPTPMMIPGNTGLFLDLKHLKVPCANTKNLISLQDIRAVKTGDSFKPFLYLSPDCWS